MHWCTWTQYTIEWYTQKEIKVKGQFVRRNDMDVNENETLSNITLVKETCSNKGYGSKWTQGAIENYTKTQIKVKEQLVVIKDMDVHEHRTLSTITLRHKLK